MFNELVGGGGNQGWYDSAASMYAETWRDILKRLTGFATGGYTGEFENGKLAVLHEKELVLNANDTANILAAVNTVRDLNTNIWEGVEKRLDSIIAQSLGMMMEKLSSTIVPDTDKQVLEQKITIERIEFPEAQDKNEILEALHSLPDMASQWARIKKD
ncbi:MAG: hypothetical protein NC218_07550 [Acetobacter sp.]|nr:hypothetical protein [Acetobacter sp.]